MRKNILLMCAIGLLWFLSTATAQAVVALDPLADGDLQARVKGMVPGNWELGLGDQVGVAGGFVQATGDDPWDGAKTYDFALNYHTLTGLADFQVTGPDFTSALLVSDDYGIQGYGFGALTLGLRDIESGSNLTSLNVFNLNLNGSALAGNYEATGTYTPYTLYSGTPLTDIALTGSFTFVGDYSGDNEKTKFDLNLANATLVPEPTAMLLFGIGGTAMAFARRKKQMV